jgi:hypothetical protein
MVNLKSSVSLPRVAREYAYHLVPWYGRWGRVERRALAVVHAVRFEVSARGRSSCALWTWTSFVAAGGEEPSSGGNIVLVQLSGHGSVVWCGDGVTLLTRDRLLLDETRIREAASTVSPSAGWTVLTRRRNIESCLL